MNMIKQDYKSQSRRKRAQILLNRNNSLLAKGFVASAFGVMLYTFIYLITAEDVAEPKQLETSQIKEVAIPSAPQSFESSMADKNIVQSKEIPLALNITKPKHSDVTPQQNIVSETQIEPLIIPTDDIELSYETVRKGDNLSAIFKRVGIPARDLINLLNSDKKSKYLTNLLPKKKLGYIKDGQGLVRLEYPINKLTTFIASRDNEQFKIDINEKQVEIRVSQAAGTIEENLFSAGYKAGLSDKLIMELAGIFEWDIDFALDIREGDTFTFIYEEHWVEGEKMENGKILAAEFINQKTKYQAVLYNDSNGNESYFTPDGYSMRKAFLRAPLNFSYISSSFKPRRFHPIQKKWKAHKGVDYRAPKGTPVYAAGDGKVIRSGYDKYNGHHVFIQHGQTYTTKYLHFSKRAVKKGQKVKQKQIIGYVGSTGLSEAPHLHYEFLVNGVHRNPRTVSLPQAKPVAKKEKHRFIEQTKALIAQLEASSRVLLAQVGK